MPIPAWAVAAPLPACSATTAVLFLLLAFADHRNVEANHDVIMEIEQQQQQRLLDADDGYYPTLIPHRMQKTLRHQKQEMLTVAEDDWITESDVSSASSFSPNPRGDEEEVKEGREVTLETNPMHMLDVEVTDNEVTLKTDGQAEASVSEVEESVTAKVPTSARRPYPMILEENAVVSSALAKDAHIQSTVSRAELRAETDLRLNDEKRPPLIPNWPYHQEENVKVDGFQALGMGYMGGMESADESESLEGSASSPKTLVGGAVRVNVAEERRHDDDSEENNNLSSSFKGRETRKPSEETSKTTSIQQIFKFQD